MLGGRHGPSDDNDDDNDGDDDDDDDVDDDVKVWWWLVATVSPISGRFLHSSPFILHTSNSLLMPTMMMMMMMMMIREKEKERPYNISHFRDATVHPPLALPQRRGRVWSQNKSDQMWTASSAGMWTSKASQWCTMWTMWSSEHDGVHSVKKSDPPPFIRTSHQNY